MASQAFQGLFGPRDSRHPLLIGVVHLKPLPGAPGYVPGHTRGAGALDAILEWAVRDAEALVEGGARAIIVENFGDAPFFKDRVPPETVAAMALAAKAVHEVADVPLGINVLRNDAAAALGIAAACDAEFIRVNVLTGAMVTDQGVIEGRAAEILRLRAALGSRALILADILVKHASPLAPLEALQAAEDTYLRGGADALLLTGAGTGKPASLEQARALRAAMPDAPMLVASGTSLDNVKEWLSVCEGAIVGTWFKEQGDVSRPVDVARVRELVARAASS